MKNPDTNAPRASRCCSCGTVTPFPEAMWKAQPRKYAIGKIHYDGWCDKCLAKRDFRMVKIVDGWAVMDTVVTNMLKRGTITKITDERGCTLYVEFTETIGSGKPFTTVQTYNRKGYADNGVAVNIHDSIVSLARREQTAKEYKFA